MYVICVPLAASMLKYFSRYGEVIDCVVMKNPATGKSRGFGFVTFKDPACVDTVLSSGPHVLDDRQVRLYNYLKKVTIYEFARIYSKP